MRVLTNSMFRHLTIQKLHRKGITKDKAGIPIKANTFQLVLLTATGNNIILLLYMVMIQIMDKINLKPLNHTIQKATTTTKSTTIVKEVLGIQIKIQKFQWVKQMVIGNKM